MTVKFQRRGVYRFLNLHGYGGHLWRRFTTMFANGGYCSKYADFSAICGHVAIKNFREFIDMLLPYMLSATIVGISLKWLSLSGNIVFQKGFTRYVNSIKLALTYPKYGIPEALTHSALQFRGSCFFFTYIAILAILDSGFQIIL